MYWQGYMSITATIGPLKFISRAQQEDTAWFWNIHLDPSKFESMRPFDNIESMTIERQYQRYNYTNQDEKYRYINIGNGLNIDLKLMIMFPFSDVNNPLERRQIARGTSFQRPRFMDRQRFSSQITQPPLKTIKEGDYNHNLIAKLWAQQNGGTKDQPAMPSVNQVLAGILQESMIILQHSVHPQSQQQLFEAQGNICQTWDLLFQKPEISVRHKPIDIQSLSDPSDPVVQLVIYIHTLESFVYRAINQAILKKDLAKSQTLGPFSLVLGTIMQNWAAESRKDVLPFGFSNPVSLFRGTQLADDQIQQYKNMQGPIRIFGYISTTLDKDKAVNYSFKDVQAGYQNVLYHIKWDYPRCHYIMDIGAFNYEKEVVLYDGTQFEVTEVKENVDQNGLKYTLITLDSNVLF